MSVRRDSPIPLYYQIRETLREEINSKHLSVGAPFPSETQLMQRFDVSRTTVRKALDDLVLEGLVRRIRGKGTLVTGRRSDRELVPLGDLVAHMSAHGQMLITEILDSGLMPADDRVAERLKLQPGAPVAHIERVRLTDGVPLCFDISWLPSDYGQRIVKEDLSIYRIGSLLEDRCGVRFGDADWTIEASVAEGSVAEALRVEDGVALLLTERVDYTLERAPILFQQSHYRADRVRFSMRLKQKAVPAKVLPADVT